MAVARMQDGAKLFEISHLRKEYQMGEVVVLAIRDVNLEVREGEFLVVLGESGSGKSTLLNIAGGIDSATSGEVLFRGQALSRMTESQLTYFRRNHVGFVFQFYNLMANLTAEENVEMATEISPDPMPAREALQLVDLDDRRGHFPSELSGGQQQRVAIARAVAKRPEVLMCDEPTGALDIATGKLVLQVLSDVNERLGTTVMVITHNAAIGDMGDRVITMADGTIRDIVEHDTRKPASEIVW